MSLVTRFVLLISALSLAGCAGGVVRETADLTATSVERVNQRIDTYQGGLERDAKERIDAIARQRADLSASEARLNVQLALWDIAGSKQAIKLYNGALQAADRIAQAQREIGEADAKERARLRATQTKFRSQSAGLTDLSNQLKRIAEEPSMQEQAKFFKSYFEEVMTELRKLEQQAEDDAAAASAAEAGA
jgi:hypothetical protein